jgi:hypothetical protein
VRPESHPIVAQVRAFVDHPPPPDAGDPSWQRAVVGEMERLLVSGYACALQLDSERSQLEGAVHDLVMRLDEDLAGIAELRRVRSELGDRNEELSGLRGLLGSLSEQIEARRLELD